MMTSVMQLQLVLKTRLEYNEGIDADDKVHRATLPMAAEVFKRGVGAYKINPESVRPSVPCC